MSGLGFSREDSGIELPINIVVMLVVGMVALAALLAIIPKSKENMSVDVLSVTVGGKTYNGSMAKVAEAGTYSVKIILKIYDKNNNPVEKASVSMSGGGGFGVTQSNEKGIATVYLQDSREGSSVDVRPNQQMIELKMIVKADGFFDKDEPRAVIIYQAR